MRRDDRRFAAASAIALPALTRALSIDYTATSLRLPEQVRFRYRLDGVDADWQDAGARRRAFYTNLGPGRYEFHVMAANEDGVWSADAATAAIVIPATFWQSRWFAFACALAAIAAGYGIHAARLRILSRQASDRFKDVLQERERIAHELHDTLLQDTQGLVLHFQVAAGRLAADDVRRHGMETLLDEADRVIARARDRVYGLRDLEGERSDLVGTLRDIGATLSAASEARFELRADRTLPVIRGPLRPELVLIAREAMLNAFRHAQARTVTLVLERRRGRLRVVTRDDGRGIDADVLAAGGRPGHLGLASMRDRARRLGGTFAVRRLTPGGTEVCIAIPARLAFEPGAGWPGRLRRWFGTRRWRRGLA